MKQFATTSQVLGQAVEISGVTDDTEAYRWTLDWSWGDGGGPLAVFVGCNPNHRGDRYDSTTAHCWRSVREDFRRLRFVNLFASRSRTAAELQGRDDPVGAENDAHLEQVLDEAGLVVACWGNDGVDVDPARAQQVARLLPEAARCWGLTRAGHPRHPAWCARNGIHRLVPFDREGSPTRDGRTTDLAQMTADEVIDRLALEPHPEGGWYRVTWADEPTDGSRGAASVIHFLLRGDEVSRWHRVDAAEVWTHVAGAPLELSVADGGRLDLLLGSRVADGHLPHAVVPAHAWQAARPVGGWTLVSCVVAPAFDFAGFELSDRGPQLDPPG